ncbi:MAG: hypothetical protein WKG03_02895 [Telluria sp.]
MEFRTVGRDELRPLTQSPEYAKAILARTTAFLLGLGATFNGKENGNIVGLSIAPSESGRELALVDSPYGKARFVFEWHVDEREPIGRLILQRQQFDNMDRVFWEPVWGVYITGFEGMYVQKGVAAPEGLNSAMEDNVRKGFLEIGMVMMLAIIKGPLVTV